MIKRFFASVFATLFLVTAIGTLAGCNTMEGVGKDIQQGGKTLKNEANEQRQKM